MTTMALTHRRTAPLRRLRMTTDVQASRPAALAAWQCYSALVVEGTSLEAGEANRRRMVRARRARRLLRAVSMPLILVLAVAGGLAIGQIGEGARVVRSIAPTRQPVYHEINTASLLPLAIVPAAHTTH